MVREKVQERQENIEIGSEVDVIQISSNSEAFNSEINNDEVKIEEALKYAFALKRSKGLRDFVMEKSCVGHCFEFLPSWLLFNNSYKQQRCWHKTLRHSKSEKFSVKSLPPEKLRAGEQFSTEVEWQILCEIAVKEMIDKRVSIFCDVEWQKLREIAAWQSNKNVRTDWKGRSARTANT